MNHARTLLRVLPACLAAAAALGAAVQSQSLTPAGASPARPSLTSSQEKTGRRPAGTLCAADEQIIFSCTLKGSAKLVSICAAKTLTKDKGYLQYRFGRAGRVELEFPQDRAGSQGRFSYEHVFRFQFDQTEIGFENGGFSYTVFDYYNGEEKPARREAGVRVRAAGGNAEEVTTRCAGRVTANYGDLSDVLTN